MTREEAIYNLKALLTMGDFRDAYGDSVCVDPYYEAVDMAVESLKNSERTAGSAQNVSNDDSISRKAAIDEIDEWIKAFQENGHKESASDACLIQDGIIQLPSVHPKFPDNWWKTDHGYMYLCPHCGLPVHSDFEECLRCGIKRPSASRNTRRNAQKRTRAI